MILIRKKQKRSARWFFATDIHGSDRCFRKFLAGARTYDAGVLLLGGDVAGKGIVPIVDRGGRYFLRFQGREEGVRPDDLTATEERIAFNGLYPYKCTEADLLALEDPTHRTAIFDELIASQLRSWMRLVEERLSPEVRCVITPGNDDPTVVDEVLTASDRVECPERAVVQVGSVTLASLGNTNPTPWCTEREYAEEELLAQIDEMLRDRKPGEPGLVFNFHCPPYDSGLDVAPELDADLRPIVAHGRVSETPVGSTAVREAIMRYQPTVALHGHIHESQGVAGIGATRCFNPGSDYSSGTLKGLLIDVDASGCYLDHLFTSG